MQAYWIYRFISPKLFGLNVSVLLLGLWCLLPAISQAEMSDGTSAQMRQLAQLPNTLRWITWKRSGMGRWPMTVNIRKCWSFPSSL